MNYHENSTIIAISILISLSILTLLSSIVVADYDPTVRNRFCYDKPGMKAIIEWDGMTERVHLTFRSGENCSDIAINIIPFQAIPSISPGHLDAFMEFTNAYDRNDFRYFEDDIRPAPHTGVIDVSDSTAMQGFSIGSHSILIFEIGRDENPGTIIHNGIADMGYEENINSKTLEDLGNYQENGYTIFMVDIMQQQEGRIIDPLLIEWTNERIELPVKMIFDEGHFQNLSCALLTEDSLVINHTGPYFDDHYPQTTTMGHISVYQMEGKVGDDGPLRTHGCNVFYFEASFYPNYLPEDLILERYQDECSRISSDRLQLIYTDEWSIDDRYFLDIHGSDRIVKKISLTSGKDGEVLWSTWDLPTNNSSHDLSRVLVINGEDDPFILVYIEYDHRDKLDSCSIIRYDLDTGERMWQVSYGTELEIFNWESILGPNGHDHLYLYSRIYDTGILLDLEEGEFTKVLQEASGFQSSEGFETQKKIRKDGDDHVVLVHPYLCIWDPWSGDHGSVKYVNNVPYRAWELDVLGTYTYDGKEFIFLGMDTRLKVFDDELKQVIDIPIEERTHFNGYIGTNGDGGPPIGLVYSRYRADLGIKVIDLNSGSTVFSKEFRGMTNNGYYLDAYPVEVEQNRWCLLTSNWQKEPTFRDFSYQTHPQRTNYSRIYDVEPSKVSFFEIGEGRSIWSHDGKVIFHGDILDREGTEVLIQNDDGYIVVNMDNGGILKEIQGLGLRGHGNTAHVMDLDGDDIDEIVLSDDNGHIIGLDPVSGESWLIVSNLPMSHPVGTSSYKDKTSLVVYSYHSMIWYDLFLNEDVEKGEEKDTPMGPITVLSSILAAVVSSILITGRFRRRMNI